MKKILIEFVLSVAMIAAVWFGLSQVDWMKLLNIKAKTDLTEEKIGDLLWKMMKSTEHELTHDSVVAPIDSMLFRICNANSIDKNEIKLHVLQKDEINAFAMPNRHLVIYSGLIDACKSEAELLGVISHELAHMEKNHVMNKLIKEIGLSVLISMSTGNGNTNMIKEAIRQLSSTAYDRNLETEADLTAVEYLEKAGVDPEPFANFLYRLGDKTINLPKQIYWISTHPESKERAEAIIKTIKKQVYPSVDRKDSLQFEQLKERIRN